MLRRRADAEERLQRLTAWLQRGYEGHDFYGVAVEVHGLSCCPCSIVPTLAFAQFLMPSRPMAAAGGR
jgi:hypothetical protein